MLARKAGNRSNASGVRGVYYEQSIKMWRAEITCPRARGGDPERLREEQEKIRFSPHARW